MVNELDRGLNAAHRGLDIAYEAVLTTVIHARRLVGVLSKSAGRIVQEVEDLVWDYQDVAGGRQYVRDNEITDVGQLDRRSHIRAVQ